MNTCTGRTEFAKQSIVRWLFGLVYLKLYMEAVIESEA